MATITLSETLFPARSQVTSGYGEALFDLTAGDKLRFQHQIDGETSDIFNETVGAGKKWSVRIRLWVEEEDA